MEAKFVRSDIQKSLSFLANFVGKSSMQGSLRGVIIESTGDGVFMGASSGDTSARCRVSGEVSEEGSVTVSHASLRGFVSSSRSKDMKIRSTERNTIVECGGSRVMFKIDPGMVVPKFDFSGDHIFTIPSGDLAKIFSRTSFVDREARLSMDPKFGSQGVRITTKSQGIEAVSHDGRRLSRVRHKLSCTPGIEMTIPPEVSRWVASDPWGSDASIVAYKTHGGIMLSASGDNAFFRTTDIRLPDISKQMEMQMEFEGTVNGEDFLDALNTVSQFSDESVENDKKYRWVLLTVRSEAKTIEMSAASSSSGAESTAVVKFQHNCPEDIKRAFDPAFLMDFPKVCGTAAFRIKFGPANLYRFEPVGDSSYCYLLSGRN